MRLRNALGTSIGQTEGLADLILFCYILAFIRQCLWVVTNDALAWILTVLLSSLLCYFHLTRRGDAEENHCVLFWLIVALPLSIPYAARAVFPDISFDVLNYHLVASERALHGVFFNQGDFFPIPWPANPLPDMVTGIFRHTLGYRVGTIVNYLCMLWVATILEKLLRAHINRNWQRYAATLLIVSTETVLYQINNYMVDLLALPLLLEATSVMVGTKEITKRTSYTLVYAAFLLGLSVAFKLTNVVFAVPIALAGIWNLLTSKSRPGWAWLLLCFAAFVGPALPFAVYMYYHTGNPVFPLYNDIFRSPYWAASSFIDPRWGPSGFLETLIWPVLLFFEPTRISELPGYTGRASVCFVVAIGCLPFFKLLDRNVRALVLIVLISSILWSYTSGYIRYGIYLELIGGVITFSLCYLVYSRTAKWVHRIWFALILLVWGVFGIQSISSIGYLSKYEWSLRPTMLSEPGAYLKDIRSVFQDYSLVSFLSSQTRELVGGAEVWIESCPTTSGFEATLKRDIPIIYLRGYYDTKESADQFTAALAGAAGKKALSLCFFKDQATSLSYIRARGLGVARIVPIQIPYYTKQKNYAVFDMVLIEVLTTESKTPDIGAVSASKMTAPLPERAFNAGLTLQNSPGELKAGSIETIYVKVKNKSDVTWPAIGREDGAYQIRLGNCWRDVSDAVVVANDGRTPLPFDLKPGDELELPLTVKAPPVPGNYVLEIDMVQELVIWFSRRGSETLKVTLKVE